MSDVAATKSIAERLGSVQAGLRSDLEVTRHLFRGQPQYVVRDPITFLTHQFSPGDYQILVTLNDAATLGEVFQLLVEQGKLHADQEEDFYQFILTLHRLNYLILPVSDGKVLYQRFAERQRTARWRQLSSFLFLRIPLVNPDAFLDRTVDFVRPLFTRTALVLWLIMLLTGAGILWQRWDAFWDPAHSILANETLVFLWLALVGLKVVHEFGHAYACKVFGGNVPEMGAFLIVFTPCAYVDASSAWGFSRMRHRVIVSLAGMYVESIVAMLALLLWCWTDDPLVSSCAHHVVVLSSAVTIGFNINPLMRYDGYYVLSDLTGVPNLRQRSVEQVQRVMKRYLLGISTSSSGNSVGMRVFLFSYGTASAIYKVTLVLAICTMIAMKFYLIGVGLAAFFLFGVLLGVVRRMLTYLWRSPETQPVRWRAISVSLVALVVIPAAAALIPVPGQVVVPGVVQTEDDRSVYAQVAGFLQPSHLTVGGTVERGETVCSLENDSLRDLVAETLAQCEVSRLQYCRGLQQSPHTATAARVRWTHCQQRLDNAEQEWDRLTVRAPISGNVAHIVDMRDAGRYVSKGQAVATIAAGAWVVRCLITAEEMADVRPHVGQAVRVRLLLDGVREVEGTVSEVAAQGTRKVFSAVLTQLGGGEIAVAPASLETNQSLETNKTLFEVSVRLLDVDSLPLRRDSRAMISLRKAADVRRAGLAPLPAVSQPAASARGGLPVPSRARALAARLAGRSTNRYRAAAPLDTLLRSAQTFRAYSWRWGRLSMALASWSPIKSSFSGSNFSLRPNRMAMLAR